MTTNTSTLTVDMAQAHCTVLAGPHSTNHHSGWLDYGCAIVQLDDDHGAQRVLCLVGWEEDSDNRTEHAMVTVAGAVTASAKYGGTLLVEPLPEAEADRLSDLIAAQCADAIKRVVRDRE